MLFHTKFSFFDYTWKPDISVQGGTEKDKKEKPEMFYFEV